VVMRLTVLRRAYIIGTPYANNTFSPLGIHYVQSNYMRF
jgi:hypothetical protein